MKKTVKKKKILYIYDPIFRVNLYVYKDWTRKEFDEDLNKHVPNHQETNPDIAGKVVEILMDGNAIYCMYIKDWKDMSVLAHECTHVSQMVMLSRDTKLTEETEELQAYYVEFLMNAIIENRDSRQGYK